MPLKEELAQTRTSHQLESAYQFQRCHAWKEYAFWNWWDRHLGEETAKEDRTAAFKYMKDLRKRASPKSAAGGSWADRFWFCMLKCSPTVPIGWKWGFQPQKCSHRWWKAHISIERVAFLTKNLDLTNLQASFHFLKMLLPLIRSWDLQLYA